MSYSYDTFENEAEISKMIKSFQSESIKHMKRYDAWEVPDLKTPVKSNKNLEMINT